MLQAIIRAEGVEKYYAQPSENRIQVISPTDLAIVPGEIVALLGPSGSGKSTLLRMLTGLSRPSAGEVYWHEKPIATADVNVSIVFQSFALFPWLTVLENVEAPLKARGMAPGGSAQAQPEDSGYGRPRWFSGRLSQGVVRWHAPACRLCPCPGRRTRGALYG
jgi:ABC-type nitrate/sulfonate/bicarbonate transport system ATPase subunit